MELFEHKGSIASHPSLAGEEAFYYVVGPALAEKLLSTYSIDYRKLLPQHMRSLARDMESERWISNGDTLKISEDGDLLDGDHRLHAVVLSGTEQIFLVVTGISNAAYDITDSGRQRRYKDALRRLEYGNVDVLASLVRMIYMWENGLSLADTSVVTYQELNDVLNKNKDLIQRVMTLSVSARKLKMAPSLTAFCWWIFMQIDVEIAHKFMSQAIDGEMIKRGMPSYTLRNRLQREYEANVSFHRNQYFKMVVDAWNAEFLGNGIDRLYVSSSTTTVKPEDIEGFIDAMKEKESN